MRSIVAWSIGSGAGALGDGAAVGVLPPHAASSATSNAATSRAATSRAATSRAATSRAAMGIVRRLLAVMASLRQRRPELALEQLAARVLGEGIDEHDPLGDLEVRNLVAA